MMLRQIKAESASLVDTKDPSFVLGWASRFSRSSESFDR